MGDTQTPATPAGNAGVEQQTVDVEAIKAAAVEAATSAVQAAVTEAIKPLSEKLTGLEAGLGKAATAETVQKTVNDAIAAAQAGQAKGADRAKFIAEKLKDVPEVYHGMLGDDPAKFAEQEQTLRAKLQADLKALGIKTPDVGGDTGGTKVTGAVDTSKLSGIELIELGVQQTSGKATAATPAAKPATEATPEPAANTGGEK